MHLLSTRCKSRHWGGGEEGGRTKSSFDEACILLGEVGRNQIVHVLDSQGGQGEKGGGEGCNSRYGVFSPIISEKAPLS